MPNKTPQQPTGTLRASQTPFERFKAAAAQMFALPKSAIPKPKKSRKK